MKDLQLIVGNPEDVNDGATYSRFVIPFAYRLHAKDSHDGDSSSRATGEPFCYEVHSNQASQGAQPSERRVYFTSEIENALFDKAKWFRLKPTNGSKNGINHQHDAGPFPRDIAIKVNGKEIAACLSTPVLVLFEFGEETKSGVPEERWDILRVAFLIVELFFKQDQTTRPTLDDLLKINELFRYFESPFDEHYRKHDLVEFCDERVFALGGTPAKKGEVCRTDFYHRWWQLIDGVPIHEGDNHWTIERGRDEKGAKEQARNTYPDNRAFVWTCAILSDGAKHLWQTLTPRYWKASNYSHWTKLLNIDYPYGDIAGDAYRSNEFERDWAERRTYHRWEELGTYYGFTAHSGAVLAPQMEDPPIWRHFGQMYFDQVLLLLYLRVVLFRFSAKLSEISREARQDSNYPNAQWAKKFQRLRWQFALFTNLYQFPLLSNQQQGVELYSLARQSMEIDELFEEVQEQIQNSHDYLAQQLDLSQTRETTLLTREIAVLTAIAAVVSVTVFGVALFTMPFFTDSPLIQWATQSLGKFKTFLVGLFVFLSPVIFWLWWRHKEKA